LTAILTAAVLLTAAGGDVSAAQKKKDDAQPSRMERFNNSHQLGLRIGGWANQGDSPPSIVSDELRTWELDFGSASFYLEGYFAYRFYPQSMLEISFGFVNRGDATFVSDVGSGDEQYVGNLLIYPILVRARLYPLASVLTKFQPYFTIGGGIYYGRHDIQFTNAAFVSLFFDEQSETDINYTIGGGIDWPLSSVVALEGDVSYKPIKFSEDLATIRDYSALHITIGAKYLFEIH
jgi:opacity protein-like surface antigen